MNELWSSNVVYLAKAGSKSEKLSKGELHMTVSTLKENIALQITRVTKTCTKSEK